MVGKIKNYNQTYSKMTNQMTQPTKTDPKGKAVASLILGIIGSIPTILLVLGIIAPYIIMALYTMPLLIILLGWLRKISFILLLLGLFLGISGLQSTKRNFAIAGITLCIIGLLVPIIYFLIY